MSDKSSFLEYFSHFEFSHVDYSQTTLQALSLTILVKVRENSHGDDKYNDFHRTTVPITPRLPNNDIIISINCQNNY